ncbi:adenylosuccinate lyase [Mycoplasma sp. ATU-Cv-703]|uniref:adenylosuccinate lyase n=1 Tax=Mycoplasma sp. ATU-Cv-703 TaxID=2498595 RepID=UPI000FDD19F8
MLTRYSDPVISQIWSTDNKYQIWLQVELTVLAAQSRFERSLSSEQLAKINANARVNPLQIAQIEKQIGHDVAAFVDQVSQTLGPEKRFFHFGLTASDVVDTTLSYQLKQVNQHLRSKINQLIDKLKEMALRYQNTYQVGRTHGVHAEPTTFGYKMALWYAEMRRQLTRFDLATQQVEIAKISGAVGNFAHLDPRVQSFVAKKFGLTPSPIASQILQRDRHAFYLQTLALIATSLDKFATEIRHLQRSEVSEVSESFGISQKGSSAMPHKQNPILSENISGLARVMRGYAQSALENVALWHERDISHSSAERIILPDATNLLAFMLTRMQNILTNLVVKEDQMLANLARNQEVIFSQRVLLYLIEKKLYERDAAYRLIQVLTQKALTDKVKLSDLLLEGQVLNYREIDELFDYRYYLRRVNQIYRKLGLLNNSKPKRPVKK